MYMNGTHQDTIRIHAGYIEIHQDTYPIGTPAPKEDRKPPVTRPSADHRRAQRPRNYHEIDISKVLPLLVREAGSISAAEARLRCRSSSNSGMGMIRLKLLPPFTVR